MPPSMLRLAAVRAEDEWHMRVPAQAKAFECSAQDPSPDRRKKRKAR